VTTFRVIGPGRAGRSLLAALTATGGYEAAGVLGRGDPVSRAARGVDLLVVATPDDAVAEVASAVEAVPTTAVLHLSGSLGLDVLAPHPRRGSIHPLVPLPNEDVGAERLRSGVTFAVAGDPITRTLADALRGRAVEVDDARRDAYHAAAVVAANHLVALLGQVERLAEHAGLPLEAFGGLVRAAADDAFALGPGHALTGPAARGDWATLERHRKVIADMPDRRAELAAYDAMVGLARRLALGARIAGGTGTVLDAEAGGEQVA
jgi:predicted short-subunit dehydrogenase-like oxidoreductase (DUF2520 family)